MQKYKIVMTVRASEDAAIGDFKAHLKAEITRRVIDAAFAMLGIEITEVPEGELPAEPRRRWSDRPEGQVRHRF